MFLFVMILIGLISFIYLLLNRNMWLSFLMDAAVFIVFIFLHASHWTPWYIWLLFFLLLGWIASITKAPLTIRKAMKGSADPTGIIHVHQGDMKGVYTDDHAVEIYAGIPYANPPVGKLRWQEPQDPDPYTSVLNADHFAPMAMQKTSSMFMQSLMDLVLYKNWNHILHERVRYPMSEDCLYLNIWKPAGEHQNLPVLFYIHGGSLTTGQAWWEDYQGESYARQNIVFITFSYRLGAFGFLADEQLQEESLHHTTGMYGFLDQIKALQWVKNNIASFGGDPDNITITGESSGSVCVNALCTSPLAHGLFQKAIGESSSIAARRPAHSLISLEDALAKGRQLKKTFHVNNIDAMRKVPAYQIVQSKSSYNVLNALCIDGYALKETPYQSYNKHIHNEKALLNGYNEKDGDYFALLASRVNLSNYHDKVEKMYHLQSDAVIALDPPHTNKEAMISYKKLFNQYVFAYGHIIWSTLASEDEPVYTYLFTKDNRKTGANHTGELQYAYGNLDVDKRKYDESDYQLSHLMQAYWIHFIRTGNPNDETMPEWKTFRTKEIMRFDTKSAMIPIPDQEVNKCIDICLSSENGNF